MKCDLIFEALASLEKGNPEVPGQVISELLSLGMLARVHPVQGPSQAEEKLRKELANLVQQHSEISQSLGGFELDKEGLKYLYKTEYEKLSKQLAHICAKMGVVRKELLAIAIKPGADDAVTLKDGSAVQLTYHGREMLHILGARIESARGRELESLLKELDWLRDMFAKRAELAQKILKATSPRMKKYDEIHLRSAAVGLSGIGECEPGLLAREFRNNARSKTMPFSGENDLLGAEVLTMMAHTGSGWDISALKELKARLKNINSAKGMPDKEIERTVAVLFSLPPSTWSRVMGDMDRVQVQRRQMGLLALAIAAMELAEGNDMDHVLSRYDHFLHVVNSGPSKTEATNSDKTAAAAFLTSSNMDTEELSNRFRAARMVLDDLFTERMDTAAALISIMSPGIMETMDNIRLAGAQITRCKLSLGGVENFSLGLKLVLQAGAHVSGSIGQGKPRPGFRDFSSNSLAMSSTVRGYGIPYLVFHRSLVHNRALYQNRYHPVHSHYVYG